MSLLFARRKLVAALSTAALAAFFTHAAGAEEPIRAERLLPGERIALDGTLSSPAWRRAPVFDRSYEIEPVRDRERPNETLVQVLYDDEALYVGVTARDPEPDRIVARPVRHDLVNRTQDFVVLYIDAIGARKSAQFFRASASGSTADGLHTAANDSEDFSPDFDYDSAVARTPQGYTTVFRVPYSSLRYTSRREGAWRIMVGRRIPRENVTLTLSVPLPREALSFIDRLQPLEGFEPPPADRSYWQLRPTLTLRNTHDQPFGGPDAHDSEARLSLDAKWRPKPELVVDATLNPDFSQVELDTPQLSRNTRFALFLTEKRPFFLESTDLLVTPTDAVYTRSINDPRWGLRATWRGDELTGTALAMHDKGGGLTPLPGPYGNGYALQPQSDAVLSRAQMQLGSVVVGALAAGRDYEQGGVAMGRNTVGGGDLQWSISENLRLKAQALGSRTTALDDGNGQLREGPAQRGGLLFVDLYGRTDRTETDLWVQDASAGFRNDLGFFTQSGVRKFKAFQSYQWFNVGPFNQTNVYVSAERQQERDTGTTVLQHVVPGWWFAAASNTTLSIEWTPAEQSRARRDAPLLSARYTHTYLETTPAAWAPLLDAWWDEGRLLDVQAAPDANGQPVGRVVPGRRLGMEVQLRPLQRLELQPRYEVLTLANPVEGRYRESTARLLAIWHLAPRQSLRLIAQRSSFRRGSVSAESESAQSLTYAWRKSNGTVLYLGATRGQTGMPAEPSRSTELFAKLQVDLREWGWL